MSETQIEQALRYVDASLEETEPGVLQRELAALNQVEYQEAGMLIEHFTKLGIEKGMNIKAIEDARKLVEHGVSWEIITSATGVKPEDLEAK